MSETKSTYAYTEDIGVGNVHISEEVVAVIAGIATTELPQVASLVGNITNAIVSKMGIKNLSQGIKVIMTEDTVSLTLTVNLLYGYNVPETAMAIQERVTSTIETMTSLSVAEVNIIVNDIIMEKN